MINFRERFEAHNSDNETIKEIDKHINEVNKQADELNDFFNYINKNNLGIDIIRPQIAQIKAYITTNLERMRQLKREFSNISPEMSERIDRADRALSIIDNEIKAVQDEAEDNGKQFQIAGSLD